MEPSVCQSSLIVRPEHLNHHGYLFGGRLLEWLDEQAYIAAVSRLKPEANLVTVAIDHVEFRYSATQGTLLHFSTMPVHAGRTSLTVFTQVFRHGFPDDQEIFRAYVTFVCLDAAGQPTPIAPLLLTPLTYNDLPESSREHWDRVERARAARHKNANP